VTRGVPVVPGRVLGVGFDCTGGDPHLRTAAGRAAVLGVLALEGCIGWTGCTGWTGWTGWTGVDAGFGTTGLAALTALEEAAVPAAASPPGAKLHVSTAPSSPLERVLSRSINRRFFSERR